MPTHHRVIAALAALAALVACQSAPARLSTGPGMGEETQPAPAAPAGQQTAPPSVPDAAQEPEPPAEPVSDEDTLVLPDPAVAQEDGAPDVQLPEEQPRGFDYIDDRIEPAAAHGVAAPGPARQISLLAGVRQFTDDTIFGDVDNEAALGIEYAHEIRGGFGWEVGAVGSLGTDGGFTGEVDVTGAAAEFYGGARYWFRRDRRWRPYLGAGVSALIAGVDNDEGTQVADDQDVSLGLYAHGGIQHHLTDVIFLGLDARGLFASDLELETVTGDADYWQLAFVLGFNL